MTALVPHIRLDHRLIRARAGELGISQQRLADLTGVPLHDLRTRADERAVSLRMLVRLARTLDLTVDELIAVGGDDDAPPVQPTPADDDNLLLAVLATDNGLSVDRLLSVLGWTWQRLDRAVTAASHRLASTPLRLAVTDVDITLVVRPGVVPAGVRERLDAERGRDRHFDAVAAAAALPLIANTIWGVFPDQGADQDIPPTLAEPILASGVAIKADAPGSPRPRLRVHPDLLFALRLTDPPEPPVGTSDAPAAVTHVAMADPTAR